MDNSTFEKAFLTWPSWMQFICAGGALLALFALFVFLFLVIAGGDAVNGFGDDEEEESQEAKKPKEGK